MVLDIVGDIDNLHMEDMFHLDMCDHTAVEAVEAAVVEAAVEAAVVEAEPLDTHHT